MMRSSGGEGAPMVLALARRWRRGLLVLVAFSVCYGCYGCLASALNTNWAPTDIDWNAVRAQDVAVTIAGITIDGAIVLRNGQPLEVGQPVRIESTAEVSDESGDV